MPIDNCDLLPNTGATLSNCADGMKKLVLVTCKRLHLLGSDVRSTSPVVRYAKAEPTESECERERPCCTGVWGEGEEEGGW